MELRSRPGLALRLKRASAPWMTLGLVYAAVAAASLFGAEEKATASAPAKSRFTFSLLPKSFQRKPKLDFNVYTEMTAEGRKRPLPTAEKPAYYIINVDKAESRGFASMDIERHAPKPAEVERMVEKALSANHYLPAKDGGPQATLVMLVHWGSYSNPVFNGVEALESGDSAPNSVASAKEALPLVLGDVNKRKAIIERASLIGGADFAKELNDVLNREVALRRDAGAADAAQAAAGAEASGLMSMLESTSPLAIFMRRDERTEDMVEEVFSDSYYVIVSALDYASVAQRKPIILWRTKLSLNAIGVAIDETVAPLIYAGADYFGKETPKALVVTRRVDRDGHVEIGETKTVEFIEPDPNSGGTAKAEKK